MIHDLENAKEMFKVADKMIQENPELLSIHYMYGEGLVFHMERIFRIGDFYI